MLTPNTYVVPPEGAQIYVVERAGVYGIGGAAAAPGASVAVTTTGPAVVPHSGVVVPLEAESAPRYVWLPAGARVYARAFDSSGPAAAAVSLWLHRPEGA